MAVEHDKEWSRQGQSRGSRAYPFGDNYTVRLFGDSYWTVGRQADKVHCDGSWMEAMRCKKFGKPGGICGDFDYFCGDEQGT